MLLENISLGRTLEIFVEREDYRYRLVSKVEDTNERRVCVTAISSNGRFFQFLPTDKIRLVYRDQEFMWEWDDVKAGLARLDDFPVHYFQISDKGRSFNRRNAYRVKLLEEIEIKYYRIAGKPGKYYDIPGPSQSVLEMKNEKRIWVENPLSPEVAKGMIKDISDNGAGIYSDFKFEIGDGIFFDIPSSYGKLAAKAEVVRKLKLQTPDRRYNYYYGCALVQSDQRLLRYIYDLQRERLKRQKESENRG